MVLRNYLAQRAIDQAEEALEALIAEKETDEIIIKQEKSPAKGFGN